MGFSPLANMRMRVPDGGRSNPRNSPVSGLGIHHNAGVDAWGQASNPNRQVSANYWIANDGTLVPNIDETRRAWTSGAAGYPEGAQADHRNITVEVSNTPEGVRNRTWTISDAAMKTLIALIADVYKRYNLGTVKRGASKGVGVHQDWVPTECPGPYIMSNLNSIIIAANELNNPKPAPAPEPEPELTKEQIMAFKSIGIGYRPDPNKDRVITTGLDFEDGQRLSEVAMTKDSGIAFFEKITEGSFAILSEGHYKKVVAEFDAAVKEKREHELAVARASAGK